MAKLTPIERFIADIPPDRRRAFDARQADAGLRRVTVTVPVEYVEALKIVARFMRNGSATMGPEGMLEWIEEAVRADYEAFDEWVARGEPS